MPGLIIDDGEESRTMNESKKEVWVTNYVWVTNCVTRLIIDDGEGSRIMYESKTVYKSQTMYELRTVSQDSL